MIEIIKDILLVVTGGLIGLFSNLILEKRKSKKALLENSHLLHSQINEQISILDKIGKWVEEDGSVILLK